MIRRIHQAESQLRTKAIKDTDYDELFGEFYAMRGEASFRLADDPVDGERYYYASAPVSTGEWMVVIRKSEAAVTCADRGQRSRGSSHWWPSGSRWLSCFLCW